MGGRPRGEARLRLEQALRFVTADFEAMAAATGLPVEQVRRTLYNMRRSGVVGRHGRVRSPASPSRRTTAATAWPARSARPGAEKIPSKGFAMNPVPPIPSRPWIASTRPDGRGMPPVIASPAPGGDGPARMRPSHQMIFEVLLARQRAGERDTTDAEIQEALERLHAPRRFDRAWIAGRISAGEAPRRPHAGYRWGRGAGHAHSAPVGGGWGRCLSGYRIGWRRRGQRQLLIGRHGTRTQYQAGVFQK
jgi:hypothetical protein